MGVPEDDGIDAGHAGDPQPMEFPSAYGDRPPWHDLQVEVRGPAAWGAITAADAIGLIIGGLVSLRFTPRQPIRFVALIGGACALSPLSLAMRWPLPAVCAAAVVASRTPWSRATPESWK